MERKTIREPRTNTQEILKFDGWLEENEVSNESTMCTKTQLATFCYSLYTHTERQTQMVWNANITLVFSNNIKHQSFDR